MSCHNVVNQTVNQRRSLNMATRHADHYARLASRRLIHRLVNMLIGILNGINIDQTITAGEIKFLESWLSQVSELVDSHPFNELVPVVMRAVSDGDLSSEEFQDIYWLCGRILQNRPFDDRVTHDMQALYGMLAGIMADGVISERELTALALWLEQNTQLRTIWPYDELVALAKNILSDQRIDESEHTQLLAFFSEFIAIGSSLVDNAPAIEIIGHSEGLCAVDPEITIDGACFCLTGVLPYERSDALADQLKKSGARISAAVNEQVNYLVVGQNGNPCWQFSCYGRKVDEAMRLRRSGHSLLLISENDLNASLQCTLAP